MQSIDTERHNLLSSLLEFTRIFYLLRTGRKFELSEPIGRESHYISICKALTKVATGETKRLIINVPPRMGKTELLIHFVAWTMAAHPDSNFIYVSYSHSLAKKQTQTIRQIIQMPHFRELFNVKLRDDSSAKDNFETKNNGSVYAVGAGGSITGRGAGIKGVKRFGGAFIIDDIHKPDEATSDTIREGVIEWFYNTAQSRMNDPKTPIIFIGQRLHEHDLPAHLINMGEWETLILPAIDLAGNALHPQMHDIQTLRKMQEENPYVFSAQYQQDPQPAGGGIFKPEWFYLTPDDQEPEILATFITADTAETSKDYNDATVFSFFGVYRIEQGGILTDTYGLHWIDCREIRVEPKDLEAEFMAFYASCMRYKVKPLIAAIEKKSTGVTLLSVLKNVRGLRLMDIERTRASGSKTTRFLEIQPYIASKHVSLPENGKHTKMCIEHMRKISANDSHRHDDVCFVSGTKIATLFGYKDIEKIKINDLIITPFGIKKVLNCGLTGKSKVINKFGLIGTESHKVYYAGKYERLDSLNDDVKVNKLSFKGLIKWKYQKLLSLMVLNIALQGREGIILASQIHIKKEKVLKDCMLRFGNFIAERKYLKAILFIIRITTILIMTFLIWNVFRGSNILKYMLKKGKIFLKPKRNWNIWKESGLLQKNGIRVLKAKNGIVKILKKITRKFLKKESKHANPVKKGLLPEEMQKHVVMHVQPSYIEKTLEHSPHHVSYAEISLPQKNNILKVEIEKAVHHCVKQEQEVYNLTVDMDGVYYANDILVSNCDTLTDAIKLALIDRVIINQIVNKPKQTDASKLIMGNFNNLNYLREQRNSS